MENWPTFSLKKVKFEGKSDYYLLARIDNNQDITLELSNGTDSFHGSISAKEMKINQQNSRLEKDDFAKLTLCALTNVQSSTDEHFYYSLQKDTRPDQWVMAWKKSIPEEDIKFQLGSAKLLAVPSTDMITTILSCATSQISDLEKEVFTLTKEKETLHSEKKDLVVMFKEKIRQKTDLETQLLTKFTIVLNKKKAKIRDLKLEIQSVEKNNIHENSNDRVNQEETVNKAMSQRSSLDSSLQFPDDSTDVPTTSRHVRRVRQARNPIPSTPPLRKKRTVTRGKNSNNANDSDLDLDTMDLMDEI